MPRYEKKGHAPVETSIAREGVSLKARGFREVKARTEDVKTADRQVEQPKPSEPAKPSSPTSSSK